VCLCCMIVICLSNQAMSAWSTNSSALRMTIIDPN
jgi:hypothetical protein